MIEPSSVVNEPGAPAMLRPIEPPENQLPRHVNSPIAG
jgi:hypothetical protein